MNNYVVGIPTRGRMDMLYQTVQAFLDQTLPPTLILVIDNNDKFGKLSNSLDKISSKYITKVLDLPNEFKCLSDACGSQTALEYFTILASNPQFAVKWDDDLVPEPNCMEQLMTLMKSPGKIAAAGGCYPKPGDDRLVKWANPGGESAKAKVPDGDPRHIQFWQWDSTDIILRTDNLYSSFMYRVDCANLIGGFCTEYSQHSFRHETDFSMRMGQVGPLLVTPLAVARHHWESFGGTRDIKGDEKLKMLEHDNELFIQRMEMFGIFKKEKNDAEKAQADA